MKKDKFVQNNKIYQIFIYEDYFIKEKKVNCSMKN